MIYETLFAPKETPPLLTDIKRALLTFDKVLIPSPNDRDLIPPQTFLPSVMGSPVAYTPPQPVRAIGKTTNYDNEFDQILDSCSTALSQGILEVFSSYEEFSGFALFGVPTGNYPLKTDAMLFLYRSMASNNDFLLAGLTDDILGQNLDYLEEIGITNCLADYTIFDSPATPLIEGTMFRPELREILTEIAKGRLSSVLKSIGYCAARNLIPFYSDQFQHQITQEIINNSTRVIDEVSVYDPFWGQRTQALRVAHDEYINESILETLSIDEVIRLRTKVWGEQAAARDNLMQSIATISKEASESTDFNKACTEKIHAYKLKAEALERDRAGLKLKISCDIGAGVLGSIGLHNTLSQVQTSIGAATTLIAGCVYGVKKIKEYGPITEQLKASEQEFKDSAGFGLHQFYKRGNFKTKALRGGNISGNPA